MPQLVGAGSPDGASDAAGAVEVSVGAGVDVVVVVAGALVVDDDAAGLVVIRAAGEVVVAVGVGDVDGDADLLDVGE